MASERIRVVLVEDHDLVREGLHALLMADPGFAVVGEARGVRDALRILEQTAPDVVLLDLRLGEEDGTAVAQAARAMPLPPRVLVLSAADGPNDLRAALNAGAAGYLLKRTSPERLREAIRKVHGGEQVIDQAFVPMLIGLPSEPRFAPELTPREQEVLDLVAQGLSNRRIAERLSIAPSTAQKHLEGLFRKFGAHDRTELVAQAFRRDLLR